MDGHEYDMTNAEQNIIGKKTCETFKHHCEQTSKASRADFYMDDGIDILPAKKRGE
jgi:hypothetical protein